MARAWSSSTSVLDTSPLDMPLYTMIELEMNRYRAFFTKLTGQKGPRISRDTALGFFRKSSLSEAQIQTLYTRIKEQNLLRDFDAMNETEFVLGMHLIVCMTKRNLVKIPANFPTYLFPTLDLTAESVVTPVSHRKKDNPAKDASVSFAVTSDSSVVDAQSLSDLVIREIHSKHHEVQVLARVEQSEARALQYLHVYVERIADQVEKLGFSVPGSTRSLDTLDDLKTLLTKHVLTAKQEVQSMEIDAQMRSVALEVTRDFDSREDPLKIVSDLTQALLALQHLTAQLMAKKADLVGRLATVTAGGSTAGSIIQEASGSAFAESNNNPAFALSKGALTVGELGMSLALTTPPKISDPALAQSHNSACSGGWGAFRAAKSQNSPPPQLSGAKDKDQQIDKPTASSDPFGFGSLPDALGAVEATGTKKTTLASAPENAFAWGSL